LVNAQGGSVEIDADLSLYCEARLRCR
jgi:hypothetical protein